MRYDNLSLSEMRKLPGIADLPIKVAGPFIKALRLEDEGKHAEAADQLDKAIAAEAQS